MSRVGSSAASPPLSRPRFYQNARVRIAAICLLPVLLLALAWWLLNNVLLVPRIPAASAPAADVFTFIAHERGLPRLDPAGRQRVLEAQTRRMHDDEAFRDAFLANYRTAAPPEQSAFRAHVFDALKPLIMRDVRQYHELDGAARAEFVDGRIVEYNRMRALWGSVRIEKAALGGSGSPADLVSLVNTKTSEQEQSQAIAYFQALAARVSEILASAELKREFEERIAAASKP